MAAAEVYQKEDRLTTFIDSYFTETEKKKIEVRSLTGGWSSAKLFHVKTPENQYALRFLHPHKSLPHEYYMLELVSKTGIAPHIYYMDAERGIILMSYINDAKTISLDEAKVAILPIAHALRQVHNIPKAPFPLMRFIDKIRQNYSKLENHCLMDENYAEIMRGVESLHLKLEARSYPKSMIHGDLHGKNMFLTKEGSILSLIGKVLVMMIPFLI